MDFKLLKLIQAYEDLIHGNGLMLGLVAFLGMYDLTNFEDQLEEIKKLKEELGIEN